MNLKTTITAAVLLAASILFWQWFGIVIFLLFSAFYWQLHNHFLLKKDAAIFITTGKSISLSKNQKFKILLELILFRCYPVADSALIYSIIKETGSENGIQIGADSDFYNNMEPDWSACFQTMSTMDIIRLIFITHSISHRFKNSVAEQLIKDIHSSIPRKLQSVTGIWDSGLQYEHDFQILDTMPGADKTTLRKNYRKLIKDLHPDTSGSLTDHQRKLAQEAFLRIHEAYTRILQFYEISTSG